MKWEVVANETSFGIVEGDSPKEAVREFYEHSGYETWMDQGIVLVDCPLPLQSLTLYKASEDSYFTTVSVMACEGGP